VSCVGACDVSSGVRWTLQTLCQVILLTFARRAAKIPGLNGFACCLGVLAGVRVATHKILVARPDFGALQMKIRDQYFWPSLFCELIFRDFLILLCKHFQLCFLHSGAFWALFVVTKTLVAVHIN
jgi:hypothetical protein